MSAKSLHRCANIIFTPEIDIATRHHVRWMFLYRCFYNEHFVYFVNVFFSEEEEDWMVATDLTLYSNPLNNALNLGIINTRKMESEKKKSIVEQDKSVSESEKLVLGVILGSS